MGSIRPTLGRFLKITYKYLGDRMEKASVTGKVSTDQQAAVNILKFEFGGFKANHCELVYIQLV